jgi:dCMP deaminase
MSEQVLLAYVPVLHEGYRRFIETHGKGRRMFLIGPELHLEYGPLAKDIRALPAESAAAAVGSWGICAEVSVLDAPGAERLAGERPLLTMPAEDVSYGMTERFFAGCEVRYDTVFLRWDKTRTAQLLRAEAPAAPPQDPMLAELVAAASAQAAGSVDWWRRVGAAIRFADGRTQARANEHLPHRLSAYAAGDPRSNFSKGVALELSTAVHAEAGLIADAAREGISTAGSVMYVTDFPCPPCAKLIAGAGVARLYFRSGYAVLDGRDVLEAAGVDLRQVG